MNRLVFPSDTFSSLRRALLAQAPNEASAVLLAGRAAIANEHALLIREQLVVPADACLACGPFQVVIKPEFLAPLIKRARLDGWSLVLAHTHPFESGSVHFSDVDDDALDFHSVSSPT